MMVQGGNGNCSAGIGAVPSIYSSAVPDLIPRHSPRQHPGMLLPFFRCLVSAFKTCGELALENLALRQQLAVLCIVKWQP